MPDRVVLWDFEGTLAFRRGMWSACLIEVLDAWQPGHAVTVEMVRAQLKGRFPWDEPTSAHHHLSRPQAWWEHMEDLFVGVYGGVGYKTPEARALAARVRQHYLDMGRWELFPDAEEALSALAHAGWRQAVLSNHVPELPYLLEGLGVQHRLSAVFTSATTGYEKPHPRAFTDALEALGRPDQVWMVGDSLGADVEGASRVGLEVVWVDRSQGRPAAKPCRRASNLLEAAAVLQGRRSGGDGVPSKRAAGEPTPKRRDGVPLD
jgi:putative hydrolase of the HAD superfamily